MIGCKSDGRRWLFAASLVAIATVEAAIPQAAHAQADRSQQITVPSMPMASAIEEIGAQAGAAVSFDPDAVSGLRSHPVNAATSLRDALEMAIEGTDLLVSRKSDGTFDIVNAIVVIARRDEAETSVLVRQASSSDRNGLGLRDQPRNTQVVTAKTISDQQALNISDILRNAGGVSAQLNNPNAGSTYTVRGFAAGGLVNGLSSNAQYGVQSGASAPIANIERIEILKGPDAILAGLDNLGGNVNVVTKKPSAETLLNVTLDIGSFGLVRGVMDANTAITGDKKLSGRLVASAQTMDHNFGGYLGNEDFLLAPSLRFKDARTDVIVGASFSDSRTGLVAFTLFDPATDQLVDRDPSVPIYSRDQSVSVKTNRYYFDATREIVSGVELVVRGLHDENSLGLDLYPLSRDREGVLQLAIRGSGQQGQSDAIDAFVRAEAFLTDDLSLRVNAGYNFSKGYFESLSSSQYTVIKDIPTGTIPIGENTTLPVTPRPDVNPPSFRLGSQQEGVFGQLLVEFWKLKLLGGFRKNWYESQFEFFGAPPPPPSRKTATSPNFGIVFDATPTFSIFANLVEGVSPVTNTGFGGTTLPNIMTRNKEVGVKLDLFGRNATINASYFDLEQDNTLVADPDHPGFVVPGPGQRGRGIDLNIVGQVMPGWTVQASYTRTKYAYLSPNASRTTVAGQPRDSYSLYTNYRRQISDEVTAGVGAGLFGRSSSFGDFLGRYVVPAAHQVDINGFVSYAGFDINLGVRNVFDRRNYNITTVPNFVPVDEPRNVRLSISKRFF